MKNIGIEFDLDVIPAFTGMDQPLGKSSGIWCEVLESYKFLKGDFSNDLYNVVFHIFQKFNPLQNTKTIFDEIISSGKGLNKFIEFIEFQGGNFSKIKLNSVNNPKFSKECYIDTNGYVNSMDTKMIGFALSHLGAGRPEKSSIIDPTCGIEFYKKIGDKVSPKSPLFKIFSNYNQKLQLAEEKIKNAFSIVEIEVKKYNPIIMN